MAEQNENKETEENSTQNKKPHGKGFNEIVIPLTKKQRKVKYYNERKYEVEKGYRVNTKFVRAIENTSIYKDTEELSLAIYRMSFNIPKAARFTYWDRLYKLCLDLIGYFNAAYAFEDKRLKYIDKYFETFSIVISLLRTGSRTKIIPENNYIAIFEVIDRIDTAIKAYRKSTIGVKKQNVQNQ